MKAPIICTVVGVVIVFVGLPPQARSTCSNPNSVLNATYGWLSDDALIASGNSKGPKVGDFVPLVQVGSLTFDGNGNVSGTHDTNLGGQLISHVDSGTYSVNSDCITGTISLSNGFIMNFVITNAGQEIKYVSATTAGVNSGTLRPIAAVPCSASTLGGNSYGYGANGLVAAGNGGFPRVGGFVPFADEGEISFGTDGTVAGVDNSNLGGVVTAGQPIAGTYNVNSDCTGTTTMTIAGQDKSWYVVILEGADQVIFVATPNGVLWGGTLTKF